MNLITAVEPSNGDRVLYLGELYKPKLVIQNGLNVNKRAKIDVYLILPSGEKAYIFTEREIEVNANDTKEIPLFNDGLKVTKDYPSGEYYIVCESVDLTNNNGEKSYGAYQFHIESRPIFPSDQNFYVINQRNANSIPHFFGYGHYSAFSNLAGVCQTHVDFKRQLKILKSYGVNFIRQFLIDVSGTSGVSGDERYIYPWNVGYNGKYDLESINNKYFTRLDLFLQVCEREKIFFQADLTDHFSMCTSRCWRNLPLYPGNNIQNSYNFPRKESAFPEFYVIKKDYPELWNVIKIYIERVVKVLKKYNYKIYLVMNEAMTGDAHSIYEYHKDISELIKKNDPNAIIAANLQNYIFPELENRVYLLKNIDLIEVHNCCGVDGEPPFGNYAGDYFKRWGKLLIPDEDGCWNSRTPENSIARMNKLISQSGRLYGIWKGPWPEDENWNEWVPFLQHAKDVNGGK